MFEFLSELTVEELRRGYRKNAQRECYSCLICGKEFAVGEIYPIAEHFYEPEKAAQAHVSLEHGSVLEVLLATDSKYLSVTEVQKNLLSLLGQGLSDKEIAAQLGITASTVRHQRFAFREKAKQAKVFLALYDLASSGERKEEAIVEIHSGAKMTDARYVITDQEKERILSLAFLSTEPLKLLRFPPKEKKKVVILSKIAERFEVNRKYSEKEVNGILQEIYDDYVTLRRYLIEYGFLDRTINCAEYWKKEE